MVTFDDYVRLKGERLVRLARLLVRDRHLAEDLVQEVLGKAFPRWGRIVAGGDPDVYLRRMLVNANNSWWRRRSASELATGEVACEVADPVDVGRGDHDVRGEHQNVEYRQCQAQHLMRDRFEPETVPQRIEKPSFAGHQLERASDRARLADEFLKGR